MVHNERPGTIATEHFLVRICSKSAFYAHSFVDWFFCLLPFFHSTVRLRRTLLAHGGEQEYGGVEGGVQTRVQLIRRTDRTHTAATTPFGQPSPSPCRVFVRCVDLSHVVVTVDELIRLTCVRSSEPFSDTAPTLGED